MSKQVFIRGSNYGGEHTIGTVTPEFVTYWHGRDEDELVQHLMALEEDYEWDTKIEFQPHSLYSREVYTQEDQQAEDELDDSVPVLAFYSSEKGDFGGWLIDLADGNEFDPNLVAVSQCETDHGEMIERLWYNKVEIEQNWNNADSRGKGYYASVAWFNNRWEDPHWNEETDKEMWDEAWEYYDDELQEKRDNLDK